MFWPPICVRSLMRTRSPGPQRMVSVRSIITTASAPAGIGAGHQARGRAGRHGFLRHTARGNFFDDLELPNVGRQIGAADRVAVDERFVVRGRIDVARNVLGQDQPQRGARCDPLGGLGAGLGQHQAGSLFDRKHRDYLFTGPAAAAGELFPAGLATRRKLTSKSLPQSVKKLSG